MFGFFLDDQDESQSADEVEEREASKGNRFHDSILYPFFMIWYMYWRKESLGVSVWISSHFICKLIH
jgi:hypothetical protein